MRFEKFLQTCTPEELAEYEMALEFAKSRVLKCLRSAEILDHPDLEVERDMVADTVAGLRQQLAVSIRKFRIAKHNERVLKEGMEQIAKIALKNAESADYWRKLALAYEVKLKNESKSDS